MQRQFQAGLTCLAVLLAVRMAKADTPVAVPTTPDAEIGRLVDDLGNPNWSVREIAMARLQLLGPAAIDPLRDAYRHSDQFEIRARIKRIVHEIHFDERVGPVRAFLGIQHSGYDLTFETLPAARIGPGFTTVMFSNIVPGSAASMAGLINGDLLIGLNGQTATTTEPATKFISWIGNQLPGTRCTLTIFRGGRGRLLNREVMRGFDVRGFSKAEYRVLKPGEDRRLPEGAAGIELTEVSRTDPRLDLLAGDVIIALNDRTLPPSGADEVFQKWLQQPPPPPEIAPPPPPIQPQGLAVATGVFPSVQIIRGGEVLDIDVTLMARPANLRGREWQREASSRAIADAEMSFSAMWNERFSEPRLTSDRHDADATWRLGS